MTSDSCPGSRSGRACKPDPFADCSSCHHLAGPGNQGGLLLPSVIKVRAGRFAGISDPPPGVCEASCMFVFCFFFLTLFGNFLFCYFFMMLKFSLSGRSPVLPSAIWALQEVGRLHVGHVQCLGPRQRGVRSKKCKE